METFKIENIKIPPIKVVPELNKETGILKLTTEVMGIITTEIAELNSQAIRESLVEMGWIPPAVCDGIHAENVYCDSPDCWLLS